MKQHRKKHEILSYIYQLRTLSYLEIKEFFFDRDNLSENYCSKIVKEMLSEKTIEKVGYHKSEAYYFITKTGIKYLSEYGLIKVGRGNTEAIPLALPPYKLKIDDKNVKHQIALNHFTLRLEELTEFDYYDEKYISLIFKNMRPDGLAVTDDICYFLEMDMNTENKRQLREKWEHYRHFLNTTEYSEMNRPVKVLFILGGGITDKSKRKIYLRHQIADNLSDKVSADFNFYFGTEPTLLRDVSRDNKAVIKSVLQGRGFRVGKGTLSDNSLSGYTFDFYAYEEGNGGKIISRGGESEEFVIDDMTDGNLYSYIKLKSISGISSMFKHKHGRDIKYLLIVNSEREAMEYIAETGGEIVYFSTIERLQKLPLHSAIFQVDKLGNIWHFSEESLRVRVDEERLKKAI